MINRRGTEKTEKESEVHKAKPEKLKSGQKPKTEKEIKEKDGEVNTNVNGSPLSLKRPQENISSVCSSKYLL